MTLTVRWAVLGSAVKQAWPVWLALGGVAAALIAGRLLSGPTEACVRQAGMLLQLFGLAMVARGFTLLQRHFGRPQLGTAISRWLALVASAFGRPRDVTIQVPAMAGSVGMMAPKVVIGSPAATTVDERLSALERGLRELGDEMRAADDALRQELGSLARDLRREHREREEADRQAADKAEDVSVGGMGLQWVGLFWLAVGVAGTSIPTEIAGWLWTA